MIVYHNLPVLQWTAGEVLDGGEVDSPGLTDNGRSISAVVAYASTTEAYDATGNRGTTVLTITAPGIHDWITAKDAVLYKGRTWQITSVPQFWENAHNYRSHTVLTAQSSEEI